MNRQALSALAIVVCFSGFFLFFRLGDRPFRNPDEGRYAQIAREMLERNDWVKPTLYGLDYLKKPPLFYWLLGASFKTFGFSEWAARAVPALAGLLGVLAVYGFALYAFGLRTALYAALLTATNFWYLQVSRYLVIDAVFSFFTLLSLLVFYLGLREPRVRGAARPLFYFCLALAFLAKGPVAIALVGLTLVVYGAVSRSFRAVVSEAWRGALWGAPLFLALVLPWFLAIVRREPEFFGAFVWHEHVGRFLSHDFEHQRPWFYYPSVLAVMLLPWLFFVRPLKHAWRSTRPSSGRDSRLYLLISAAAIVFFYSLARSKMPTYLVPCLPLLALLVADGWKNWLDTKPSLGRAEWAGAGLVAAVGVAGIVGVPLYLDARPDRYPPQVKGELQLLGVLILAGAVFAAHSIRRAQPQRLFYSLIGLMGLLSIAFTLPMETMNPRYSTKAFAEELKLRLEDADEVFIFDHPGPFYDFAFYLGRPVKMVGLEGEFEGSEQEHQARLVSVGRSQFDAYLRQDRRLYCLIRKSDFQGFPPEVRRRLRILKQDGRKVLFSSGFQGARGAAG